MIGCLRQVYRGKVSNVMDFGAFVELQGMRQKSEGLVHVSEIRKTHCNSAKEILKRGEDCWVKVMRVAMAGDKQQLSLSMRDVDQVCHLPGSRPHGSTHQPDHVSIASQKHQSVQHLALDCNDVEECRPQYAFWLIGSGEFDQYCCGIRLVALKNHIADIGATSCHNSPCIYTFGR